MEATVKDGEAGQEKPPGLLQRISQKTRDIVFK
jgi:hypothetical protein